jgi:hypothetical protein
LLSASNILGPSEIENNNDEAVEEILGLKIDPKIPSGSNVG